MYNPLLTPEVYCSLRKMRALVGLIFSPMLDTFILRQVLMCMYVSRIVRFFKLNKLNINISMHTSQRSTVRTHASLRSNTRYVFDLYAVNVQSCNYHPLRHRPLVKLTNFSELFLQMSTPYA